MSTALLLLLSAGLIASGVTLVWRDVHMRRRVEENVSGDSGGSAGLGATAQETTPAIAAEQPPTLARRLVEITRRHRQDVAGEGAKKSPPAPPEWVALQPEISSAVEQVNAVLTPAGVAIDMSGDPSWGPDQGYGSDRHILAGGQSLARLRLECMQDGRFKASVTAHDQSLATEIEADGATPVAEATIARVSELVSKCMKPVASYAMRAKAGLDQQAAQALESLVMGALRAGSGALSLAGARLVVLAAPAWDAHLRLHRMPVSVQVYGADVARMHVDRREDEIEVAVGLPDRRLMSLGRRERVPLQGLTTHTLAEAIASCAWPAIEHRRQTTRQF